MPPTKSKKPVNGTRSRPKRAANGTRKNGNGNSSTRNAQPVTVSTMQRAIANSTSQGRPAMTMPITVAGTDYLSKLTVTTAPGSTQARILFSASISPSFFLGTRLTQFSNLYERYLFNKFQVRYVPAVPTTLACQLLAYIDTDPTDDPTAITDPDALYRQAVAQSGSRQWNFIAGQSIPLVIKRDKTLYYTGATRVAERLNLQGKIYILQITNPIAFNGAPIEAPTLEAGSLFMDWNCTFSTPQINPESAVYAGRAITYLFPPPSQLQATNSLVYDGLLTFTSLEPNAIFTIAAVPIVGVTGFPATPSLLTLASVSPGFKLGDSFTTSTTIDLRVEPTFVGTTDGAVLVVRSDENGVARVAFDNVASYTAVYAWSGVANNSLTFGVTRLYV